jgi:hypothetical protein
MQKEFIEITKRIASQNNNNNPPASPAIHPELVATKEMLLKSNSKSEIILYFCSSTKMSFVSIVHDEMKMEIKHNYSSLNELLSSNEKNSKQEINEFSLLIEKKQKNFEISLTNTLQQSQFQQLLTFSNNLKEELFQDSSNLLEKIQELEKNNLTVQVNYF